MRKMEKKEKCWMVLLTMLCILCFPANPLVLAGLIEPAFNLILFILGWIVWTAGMILVLAPVIMFPRYGDVPKGKSFVHTSRLVKTGVYGIVRHPQYLGGILSIFIATPLLYPHWLFVAAGIPGILILYLSTKKEEEHLIRQFGDEYISYMKRVPSINIIKGIYRRIKNGKV